MNMERDFIAEWVTTNFAADPVTFLANPSVKANSASQR